MAHYTITNDTAHSAVILRFSGDTTLRDLVFLKQHLDDSPLVEAVSARLGRAGELPVVVEVETGYGSEILKTVRSMCADWRINEIDPSQERTK